MDNGTSVTARILMVAGSASDEIAVRDFCERQGLAGLRVEASRLRQVLATDIGLGCIVIPQRIGDLGSDALPIAREIAAERPELPLMLLTAEESLETALEESDRRLFSAVASASDLTPFARAISESLFSSTYPPPLLRGIIEIARQVLEHVFRSHVCSVDPPLLVRDRLIHGELFALIPLETDWCRGYMALQADESSVLEAIAAGWTALSTDAAADFRSVNILLSEVTNMIWGSFRNRFATETRGARSSTEVPIVINQQRRYISFGSTDPHVCLSCTLLHPEQLQPKPITVDLRFVFNLLWAPEQFLENDMAITQLVADGELELF